MTAYKRQKTGDEIPMPIESEACEESGKNKDINQKAGSRKM
jgi:hypothetical protein